MHQKYHVLTTTWKIMFWACLLALVSACSDKKIQRKKPYKPELRNDTRDFVSNEDTLKHYSIVVDSIRSMEIPHSDLKAAIVNSFVYKGRRFSSLKEMTVQKVLEMIEIHPFNDQLLVTISDDEFGRHQFPVMELYLFDVDYNYLSEAAIDGSKYDIGTISISDIDNDSREEIIYQQSRPFASMDAGSEVTSFYQFDASRGLTELFTFVDSEWECIAKNPNAYDSIRRDWIYSGIGRIKITEEKWWRNCWAGHQEDRNAVPELISREHSYFFWDSKLAQFVPR